MTARMEFQVAIGLGSNLGDRLANLRLGLSRVGAFARELNVSSVYETDPVGCAEQPRFLNACCTGLTKLTARQVLSELQDAERSAGRRSGVLRFGPRELDLDVLLYADLTVDSEALVLPHPRLRDRAFVLVPLAEIAPDWTVPAAKDREEATVAELSESVSRSGIRRTELEL